MKQFTVLTLLVSCSLLLASPVFAHGEIGEPSDGAREWRAPWAP